MAKGFKAGGGSANLLNCKVVGNPQPESSKENTIWVDTDVEITGWHFSATQPENMAEGEVWFATGTSSPAALNVLKKNAVMVYPLKAMQYVNGTLVNKTAQSYQDGKWVEWFKYLVKDGIDNTGLTGGWSFVAGGDYASANVSNGALRIGRTWGYGAGGWEYMTEDPIDLTEVETIELLCDATANASTWPDDGGGRASMKFYCKSSKSAGASALATIVSEGTVTGKTVTLNVSDLSGNYYLSIWADAYGASNTNITANVYDLKLVQ